MNTKFIISDVCYILIDAVKFELYQGNNKNPFYYVNGKEVYLNFADKMELDNLIKQSYETTY